MKFKKWFRIEESAEKSITSLIDGEGYILFFKKGDEIYGADEDSRIVFAKIKHPDEDMPSNWKEEANFSAHNLNKMLRGEPGEHIFGVKDLKELKVMDRDAVVEDLKKNVKDIDKQDSASKFKIIDIRSLLRGDPDEAPNFVRADED